MTSFEGSVIVLLLIIAVGVVWIGMRQDTKLYFIKDKLGIVLGFLNKIGRSDPKIYEIEKNTYGILDVVGKMHDNLLDAHILDKLKELDKPFEPVSRDELRAKYVDILAGHVDIFHNPNALELTGTFVNAMADLGWLDIISRYEPKAEAVQ